MKKNYFMLVFLETGEIDVKHLGEIEEPKFEDYTIEYMEVANEALTKYGPRAIKAEVYEAFCVGGIDGTQV